MYTVHTYMYMYIIGPIVVVWVSMGKTCSDAAT